MKNVDEIFKQKADYYDEALRLFGEFRKRAYGTKLELLEWFSDFSIFTLLGAYDLWIILIDYQKAIKVYQRTYYARQAALICFELLSDNSQQIGNEYIKLLIEKVDEENISKKAIQIRKDFNKLRSDNESKFKDIRDYTIAHRDHNISNQLKIINSLDMDWIMEFSMDYLNKIEELHSLFNQFINKINIDGKDLGKDEFLKKYTYIKNA